jgi:hypothetical protein
MKYASKFVVVPYVPQIKNQIEDQITSLDQKMSSILHDKTLPVDVKVKLYNKTLSEYNKSLNYYNLTTSSEAKNSLAEQSSRIVDAMIQKLEPQLTKIEQQTAPLSSSSSTPLSSSSSTPLRTSKSMSKSLNLEDADDSFDSFNNTESNKISPETVPTTSAITSATSIKTVPSSIRFEIKNDFYAPVMFTLTQMQNLEKELKTRGLVKVDKNILQQYFEKEGLDRIEKVAKAKPTIQTRAVNEEYIKIYLELAKPQKASGLKKFSGGHNAGHKQWIFKNFF